MKNYNCRKCGSIDLFIKANGTQVGSYCSDCGAWQKWLSKDEQRLVEQWIENLKSEKKQMITKSEIGIPVINNNGITMRENRNIDNDIPWDEEDIVEDENSDYTYELQEILDEISALTKKARKLLSK